MTLTIDGSPVVVAPTDSTKRMHDAWWGVHFRGGNDARGNGDAVAYRAMIAASPPEPLAAILEMREVLQAYVDSVPAFRLRPVGGEGSPVRRLQELQIAIEDRARAILARVTTGEARDAG